MGNWSLLQPNDDRINNSNFQEAYIAKSSFLQIESIFFDGPLLASGFFIRSNILVVKDAYI